MLEIVSLQFKEIKRKYDLKICLIKKLLEIQLQLILSTVVILLPLPMTTATNNSRCYYSSSSYSNNGSNIIISCAVKRNRTPSV